MSLRPVRSIDIPTNPIPVIELTQNRQTVDVLAEFEGYAQNATIRNFSPNDILFYRTARHTVYAPLPPTSEITLDGWLDYIDMHAYNDTAVLSGQVSIVLAKARDVRA